MTNKGTIERDKRGDITKSTASGMLMANEIAKPTSTDPERCAKIDQPLRQGDLCGRDNDCVGLGSTKAGTLKRTQAPPKQL